MFTVKIMVIKINVQGLVGRLNVSWIWWFYETFWDLVEREKPTLSFFSKLEVLEVSVERYRSTDVLTTLTIFRPSPVSSAVSRVLFPADQVNWWRPLPPYIKNSSVADEKCAISSWAIPLLRKLCSRPRPISTSWWSTKAIPIVLRLIPPIMTQKNWSMVNLLWQVLKDKSKCGYGLMFRQSQNGKPRH